MLAAADQHRLSRAHSGSAVLRSQSGRVDYRMQRSRHCAAWPLPRNYSIPCRQNPPFRVLGSEWRLRLSCRSNPTKGEKQPCVLFILSSLLPFFLRHRQWPAMNTNQRTRAVRAVAFELAGLTLSAGGVPDAEDWEIAEMLCACSVSDENHKIDQEPALAAINLKILTDRWTSESHFSF